MTRASLVGPDPREGIMIRAIQSNIEAVPEEVVRDADRYQTRDPTVIPLDQIEKAFESPSAVNLLENSLHASHRGVQKL